MSDQILKDPRAGWAMALCSGDCNSAWLLSDLWFLDGEIICDDCLHDADGPDDRLARAQPFIGPDKNRIAELEAENARLREWQKRWVEGAPPMNTWVILVYCKAHYG